MNESKFWKLKLHNRKAIAQEKMRALIRKVGQEEGREGEGDQNEMVKKLEQIQIRFIETTSSKQ